MNIYEHITDTIGKTPLVKANSFSTRGRKGIHLMKIESFNPGSSSKDRIGVTLIEDAEKKGLLKPGGIIVEATSGNTGLGLALVAKKKGYKVILVMPDKMSPAKMNLVKAVGCEVVVCPTEVEPDDPRSYYSVSKKIAEDTPNSFYANQYHNEANPVAHYRTTGPEIWEATEGKITHFFAGVGTGGTISGTAKYLKEKNPNIKIIGVDPKGSILAHYHKHRNMDVEAKGYKIEGVGEDIIPSNVHFDLIDDFITINDKEAFEWSKILALEDGILVGGSSGMAAAGAFKYSQDFDEDSVVVTLLPDTGERYLGKVFSDSWLRSNGFLPQPSTISEILMAKSANLPSLISVAKDDTIATAMSKIFKFDIDYILYSDASDFRVLKRSELYSLLLNHKSLDTPIHEISSMSPQKVDINTSLKSLINTLRSTDPVLITENEKVVGFLSRQDIFDNISINELQNY